MADPISADKVIGKTLIAKTSVEKLNWLRQKTGVYKTGDVIGVVSSYVQLGTPNIFWVIGPYIAGRPDSQFLVQHEKGRFQITDEIKAGIQAEKDEIEKKKLADKGAFRYYVEKYGLVILLVIAGTILGKTALQKK